MAGQKKTKSSSNKRRPGRNGPHSLHENWMELSPKYLLWGHINSLTTQEPAILIQLRTDHNRLRKYLYRRKLAESDQCECGQNEYSTRHLLLECPEWEAQRQILRPKVGARWGDLPYMLGGWNSWKDRRGKTLDGPRENWRPSVSTVKAVIKFVIVLLLTNLHIMEKARQRGLDEQMRWTTAQPEPRNWHKVQLFRLYMVAERQNRQFFPKNVQLVQRQTTNHPRKMIKT